MSEQSVNVPVNTLVDFMMDALTSNGHPSRRCQDHCRCAHHFRSVGRPLTWHGSS